MRSLTYFFGFETGSGNKSHNFLVGQITGNCQYPVGCGKVDVPLVAGYRRIERGFYFGDASAAFGVCFECACFHSFYFLDELFPFQSQAVENDRYRAECHSGTRPHGIEHPAVYREQYPGGDGNTYDIVDERPKEVFSDNARRAAGKPYGTCEQEKVGIHECNHCYLHRYIGPLPHGYAHVGAG